MTDIETLLDFIQKIEAENSQKNAYEIANILRGYSKQSYTSQLWTAATGYEQKYINGALNHNVIFSGVETDFGHFIGSLSDQINEPGMKWSDITFWTADHTSWAGDIGSAIAAYRSALEGEKIPRIDDALNRFARASDYTANIAAFLVGEMINSRQHFAISSAILTCHRRSYKENIQRFIQKRFKEQIEGRVLKHPANIEAQIRRSVSTFMNFSMAADLLKSVKSLPKLEPYLEAENMNLLNGYDLLRGSIHFLTHLIEFGGLKPLEFKPYRRPRLPWFGTVNYLVQVPKFDSKPD